MQRLAPWLFAVLVLIVISMVVGSSLDFQQCVEASRQHRPTNQHFDESISGLIRMIPTYRHCVGSYVTDKNAAITALGTIVVAIFTTVLGLFTVSLARSTRIAANAAKNSVDTLPVLERAYLFVYPTITWSRVKAQHADKTTTPPFVEPIQAWFHFVNHGKTPAIMVGIEAHLQMWTDAPDNVRHISNLLLDSEIVIESKEQWPRDDLSIDLGRALRDEEFEAIDNAQAFIWFYGSVVYHDIFGNEHVTRFRWRCGGIVDVFTAWGGAPYNDRT